jgi:hypothetical protein
MRIEFSPFGVHVSAIAPGSISTPMLNRSSDQLNRLADALPKSLQPFYADALRAFAKTVASAQRFSTSPAKASLTILRAVTAPRPRTRYLIGMDAKLSAFLKRNLPDRWMDAIIFQLVGLPRQREQPADQGESDARRVRCQPAAKKCNLPSQKDGWLVYTEPYWGSNRSVIVGSSAASNLLEGQI